MKITNLQDAGTVLTVARNAIAKSLRQSGGRTVTGRWAIHHLKDMADEFRGVPIYKEAALDLLRELGVDPEAAETPESNPEE